MNTIHSNVESEVAEASLAEIEAVELELREEAAAGFCSTLVD